jgi:tetratricopeptide (TPR) repeat protein
MGWNAIGETYLSLNKIPQAKEMFKKARHCSNKYLGDDSFHLMRAHWGLGRIYLKEKKIKKALHHYVKQLKIRSNYEIEPAQMALAFEELQKTFQVALHTKGNVPYVYKAAQETTLLSEKILGKDHALTKYFQQTSSKIDNSKVKI